MSQANSHSHSSTTQSPQSHTHRAFPAAPQILGGGGGSDDRRVLPLSLALAGLLTLLLPASVWARTVTDSQTSVTLNNNDNLTVEASGAIVSTGSAVSPATVENISVTNRGRIEGRIAIDVRSILRLENSKTIKGVTSSAISVASITELFNLKDGTISSDRNNGIIAPTIGRLENAGTIKGSFGGAGIRSTRAGTLINKKGGVIESASGGLSIGSVTRLENHGAISAIKAPGSISDTAINLGFAGPVGTLINSGTILGPGIGIRLDTGSSITLLENSGKIEGTDADGIGISALGRIITLINKGNGEILGGAEAITAASIGRLENSGRIKGASGNGISVTGRITTLINKGTGEISGGAEAISAASIGRLENSGKIKGGAEGNGINVATGAIDNLENSGEISGGAGEAGVDVNIITTKLFNKKGGTISGGFAGLIVRNRIGELENNGVISGRDSDGSGIFMSTPDLLPGSNTRIDTLTNRGAITGADNGIQTTSIGVLTNSGRIAGGNSTARDANNSGLYVFNGITTLTNTSTGDISGGQRGVSAASIGRLDNSGKIRGANEVGINTTGNITTLINRSAGDISGGQRGVSAASIASLNNSGRIRGAANAGVRLTGTDATVTVTNSGKIQGGTYGLNYGNNAITRLQNTTRTSAIRGGRNEALSAASLTTLNNEGTIASNSAAAITLTGSTTQAATVSNSGTIQGQTHGLDYGAHVITRLTNSGAIIGTTDAGVTFTGNTTQAATITNTGTIRGGTYGLNYGNNPIASLTNTSPRTLRGGSREALSAGSLLTLNNSGTILSDKASAITLTRTAAQAATITNSGTIQGNIHGLDYNNNAIASLTNSGTIRGTTGIGIKAAGLTTLNNTGTIEGQTGIQIARTGTGQTGATINNAGTLRSLKGASGTALDLQGPGRDTLKLQAGSTLEGQVRWDGQDDTLNLATGPARLTLIDNNAEPGQAPTPFTINTNGRPFLLNTTTATARGQAQTTVTVLDPARIHTRTESTQSQWTGALFQSLAQQQGTRTGPNARNSTAAVYQTLWVRPFGGLHNFKRDGLTPAARYRYGGALAGYAVASTDWQAGGFVGAAQDTLAARGPGADAEGRHVFAGAYARTRWQALNLKVGLLFGQSRTETEWQRLNNQVTGGQERVVYEGRRYLISPELGLATRLTVRGVALEPALSLRYLGLFGAEEDERLVAGREPLRFRAEDRHVGLVRASVGMPLRFPVNAYGGQLYGQLRVGAEGRKRFGGERIEARRGDGVVRFKVADEATVRGFMGAGFEYVVPDLNLSFSADFEASYGSEAVLGVQGQLGVVWGF